MIRKIYNQRGIFVPCALGLATLLLVLGMMGASATSAGRRTLEVSRGMRWVRLAGASAFDEAVARITDLTRRHHLPPPSGPDDPRDLSGQLAWLEATPVGVPLANQCFKDESVQLGDVTFKTGPWTVQSSSGGGQRAVREVAVVELSVIVTVSRPGQRVTKRVTAQRYATAVPLPPNDPAEPPGFAIVISPRDLYHAEEALR